MTETCKKETSLTGPEQYRDKVLGCWAGKNIGGTLGVPFEWDNRVQNVNFYTQDLKGKPEPNDDLDLQLVWLNAAEVEGIYHINERVLGEYWMEYVTGPWNEYGVCKANMRNGLMPPLSGSCNNDRWKYSNGAWIRSEIWACIFAGNPDEAAKFAYYDSCCDHCGEGIYAEIFTATMQAAAFVINDVRQLIEIGLAKIPPDCRITRSVKLVCDHYDKGSDFLKTREAVVKDSEDLGWFQAPGNIGFVIIGLLYGKGDFGKSICIATNCGDDTDCTAGTVGALLGIIYGYSKIPQKWLEPIGNSIQTCSVETYHECYLNLPKDLDELTDRTINVAKLAKLENPGLFDVCAIEKPKSNNHFENISSSEIMKKTIWNQSPYEMNFDLPYGKLYVEYEDGPEIKPGAPKRLILKIGEILGVEKIAEIKLLLPEGWQALPAAEVNMMIQCPNISAITISVIPQEFDSAYFYLPVEIRISGRRCPEVRYIPMQQKGCINHTLALPCQKFFDTKNRQKKARR